jgi:hypothetical protein
VEGLVRAGFEDDVAGGIEADRPGVVEDDPHAWRNDREELTVDSHAAVDHIGHKCGMAGIAVGVAAARVGDDPSEVLMKLDPNGVAGGIEEGDEGISPTRRPSPRLGLRLRWVTLSRDLYEAAFLAERMGNLHSSTTKGVLDE